MIETLAEYVTDRDDNAAFPQWHRILGGQLKDENEQLYLASSVPSICEGEKNG